MQAGAAASEVATTWGPWISIVSPLLVMGFLWLVRKETKSDYEPAGLKATVDAMRIEQKEEMEKLVTAYKEADKATRDAQQTEVLGMSERYTVEVKRLQDIVAAGRTESHEDAREVRQMIRSLEEKVISSQLQNADERRVRDLFAQRTEMRLDALERENQRRSSA